jgi:hypothetical protein
MKDSVKGKEVVEFEDRKREEINKEYVDQSLAIINQNQLLKQKDFESLMSIKDELNHNFNTGQMFRSRVEMEVSVLNDIKFSTTDAKYWQSVREQNVHFSELVMLSYEYKKTQQKMLIMGAKIDELEDKMSDMLKGETLKPYEITKIKAEIELKKIDIERSKFMSVNQMRTAKDRMREVLNWHDIMKKLKPLMQHGIDSYEDHQLESYMSRFQNQLDAAKRTGANFGPAEAANLLGQLKTTQRVIDKKGPQLGPADRKEPVLKLQETKEQAQKLVLICSECKVPVNAEDMTCPKCLRIFTKD